MFVNYTPNDFPPTTGSSKFADVMPSADGRTKLPGFGLPVDHMPNWRERFPHAIADDQTTKAVTFRERRMLKFINQITDKPEWNRKVFDESIVSKWREEASEELEDETDVILSERMFDFVGSLHSSLPVIKGLTRCSASRNSARRRIYFKNQDSSMFWTLG